LSKSKTLTQATQQSRKTIVCMLPG